MKSKPFWGRRMLPLMILVVGLLLAGCGPDMNGDNTIFGGVHTIENGDVIRNSITQFGGVLNIEEGAIIEGDLTVLGGRVELEGAVEGTVTTLGGVVIRGPDSTVGDITMLGGETRRSERSEEPASSTPESVVGSVAATGRSAADRLFGVFQNIFGILITAIGMGLVALLTSTFLPDRVRHVAHAASEAPAATIGVGCLSMPVLFVATLLLIITIIGTPLLLLVMGLALILGTVGIGYALGDRLLRAADLRAPRLAAAATIGTAVLMVGYAALDALPLIGFVLGPLLGGWALGAVILTRGGGQPYPANSLPRASAPYSPAPPTPYAPPPTSEEETLSTDELLSQLAADLQLDDEEDWDGQPPTDPTEER